MILLTFVVWVYMYARRISFIRSSNLKPEQLTLRRLPDRAQCRSLHGQHHHIEVLALLRIHRSALVHPHARGDTRFGPGMTGSRLLEP
jgi:hypothetical protein